MGGGAADGTLRRYVVWDDDRIVKAPDNLSIEEVATLYTAGVTAWNSLFHGKIKLEPGMTVLTQGTGGVSCFAIQVSRMCPFRTPLLIVSVRSVPGLYGDRNIVV